MNEVKLVDTILPPHIINENVIASFYDEYDQALKTSGGMREKLKACINVVSKYS